MSHILDALRKAQDETIGKPRQSVIGGETLIARRNGVRLGGMTKRVWIMAGAGVVLLGIVAWALYGSPKPSAKKPVASQKSAPAPASSTPSSVAPPMTPPPPPSPATASTPAVPQQQPSPPLKPAIALPKQAPAVQAPTYTAPPDDDEEEGSSRNRKKKRGSAAVPSAASAAPAKSKPVESVSSGTLEGIKLTGIAWQENRSMRRAVVNDVLMGEGTMVAGVKVMEIRPAMVRFEKNGTIFEVTLPR